MSGANPQMQRVGRSPGGRDRVDLRLLGALGHAGTVAGGTGEASERVHGDQHRPGRAPGVHARAPVELRPPGSPGPRIPRATRSAAAHPSGIRPEMHPGPEPPARPRQLRLSLVGDQPGRARRVLRPRLRRPVPPGPAQSRPGRGHHLPRGVPARPGRGQHPDWGRHPPSHEEMTGRRASGTDRRSFGAGCPRQASPGRAIALLGGALAGSGPETSPCVDGLSLTTGMVVPSTLRVQTTHQEGVTGQRLRHGWRTSIGSRMLGRCRSVPVGGRIGRHGRHDRSRLG